MNRSSFYAAGLTLCLLSIASAADQLYSLTFPDGGVFNAIDGQPYLMGGGKVGPPGNAPDIRKGMLVHAGSDKVLTYPLEGEMPVVTLGDPNGGDQWDLPKRESFGYRVRATQGKFKGWYLDWSDKQKEIKVGNTTYHVQQLILVQEPKQIRKFRSYPVAK